MLRGLDTPIRAIRRQVFTEVAKLGLKANSETLLDDMEEIPYEIVNEDTETVPGKRIPFQSDRQRTTETCNGTFPSSGEQTDSV